MKIRFWGTRGSIPTPGKQTVRYGGNTPCVELRLDNDDLIILDAGTGIRNLGDRIMERGSSIKAYILITHPHWDHIQGIPFFKPAFISGNELTLMGSESEKITLRRTVSDLMNKIYFPIQLNELKAKLYFRPVKEEEVDVFDAKVRTLYVNHPAYCLGFRVNHGGKSVVYISDNEPFDRQNSSTMINVEPSVVEKYKNTQGDPNQRLFDFVKDCDVLIHDTTYTPEEYVDRVGWGHSHYLFTVRVAAEGNVKQLILFHHDPSHSDDKVDDIVAKCQKEIKHRGYAFRCQAAAEGLEIEC